MKQKNRPVPAHARIEAFLLEHPGERYSETQLGQRFDLTGRGVKLAMARVMAFNARIISDGGAIRHYAALSFSGRRLAETRDLVGYTENLLRTAETRMSLRGARWRLDQPAGWRPGQAAA